MKRGCNKALPIYDRHDMASLFYIITPSGAYHDIPPPQKKTAQKKNKKTQTTPLRALPDNQLFHYSSGPPGML